MDTVPYLQLDCIQTNPQLMMMLPSDIAYRYHALPVATDGIRVTVAMADPGDTIASTAVSLAIGAPTCLVQANLGAIDQRLTEIWPQKPQHRLRMFVWTPQTEFDSVFLCYAQEIAALLQADIKQECFPWRSVKSFETFINEVEHFQPDLIVFHIPTRPQMNRLLIDFAVNKLVDQLTASILIVRNPRWPLQRLLLAIRNGKDQNKTAIDWVIQLAHSSNAAVTVLPLLPPVPLMYGSFIDYSLPSLLTSTDPLGKKMRWVAERLTAKEIEGTFKIHDGHPLEQLCSEISESNTDLIIIEATPPHHQWRWLLGEVVNNLFTGFDRPLLITK